MENNQTAVEWLVQQVKSPEWQDCFIWHKEEIFQQALAMEKEQIIAALDNFQTNKWGEFLNGEEYYEETYGNSKP
jgi:hypothetical protein